MISNAEFRKTFLIQIMLAITDSIGFAFMYLYFFSLGYTIKQLLIAGFFGLCIPVLVIAAMSRYRTKLSFAAAYSAKILCYIIALNIAKVGSPALVFMVSALVFAFFWIPYNLEFFSYTTIHNKAFSGGLQVAIYPLIGMIFPVIAGYIFQNYGFKFNMYFAMAILSAGIIYIIANKSIKMHRFEYKLFEVIKSMKKLKSLCVLQGMYESSYFIALPAFTLLFISTGTKLGIFYSYWGLLSVAATLLLAKLSDKIQKRTTFIYPIVILTAFSVIAVGFATNMTAWIILTGILEFFAILSVPFLTAVALDAKSSDANLWAGRELLLNLGRAMGVLIVLLIYIATNDYRPAFLALGVIFLLYPIVLHMKKLYPKAKDVVPGQIAE